ncbi:hypothetical protein I552_10261 [Mycobacterium xenopi 3993]|nr:hypothetical protein I552_10261 [Mycobacterium xenopi 3993]
MCAKEKVHLGGPSGRLFGDQIGYSLKSGCQAWCLPGWWLWRCGLASARCSTSHASSQCWAYRSGTRFAGPAGRTGGQDRVVGACHQLSVSRARNVSAARDRVIMSSVLPTRVRRSGRLLLKIAHRPAIV